MLKTIHGRSLVLVPVLGGFAPGVLVSGSGLLAFFHSSPGFHVDQI